MRKLWLCLAVLLLLTPAAQAQQGSANLGPIGILLNSKLEQSLGFRISFGEVRGDLMSAVILRKVAISDRRGVFLRIGELRLGWSPGRLASGELRVSYLQIIDAKLLRAPEPREPEAPPAGQGAPPKPGAKPQPKTPPAGQGAPKLPPILDRLIVKGDLDLPLSLDIAEIHIDRIELAAPVLGAAAALSLQGKFRVLDSGKIIDIDLRLTRLSGAAPDGHIRIRLPEKKPRTLAVAVRFDDEPGGLLGRALGLDPRTAIRVRADGDAPLDDWTGRITAAAGDAASLTADIETKLAPGGRLISLRGKAASGLLARRFPDLGGELTFRFAAVYGETAVEFRDVAITAKAAELKVTGRAPFEGDGLDVRLALTAPDLGKFAAATGLPAAGDGQIQLRLHGNVAAPALDLDARVARLTVDRLVANQAALRLRFTPAPAVPGEETPAKGKVALAVTAASGAVVLPDGSRRPLRALGVTLTGDVDWPARRLSIARMTAEIDRITLTGKGEVLRLAPLRARGEIAVSGDLPADLLGGVALAGANLQGVAAVDEEARTGSADITFRTAQLQTGVAAVDALLAGAVTGRLDARWQGERVSIGALHVESAGLNLNGSGSLGAGKVDRFRFTARAPDLALLSRALGVPLKGTLSVTGDVRGAGGAIGGTVEMTGDGVVARGIALGAVALKVTAEDVTDTGGQARLSLTTTGGKWTSNVQMQVKRLSATLVQIDRLAARLPGARLDVSGQVALGDDDTGGSGKGGGPGMTGTIRLRANSLAAALRPFNIPAAGTAYLTVRLRRQGGRQSGSFALTGRRLRYGYGGGATTVQRINARLAVWDLQQMSGVTGRLSAAGVNAGGVAVNSAAVTARAGRGGTRFTANAATRYRLRRARVSASGLMRRGGGVTHIRLETLNATYQREKATLAAPASLSFGPGVLSVEDARIRVGKGGVSATYIRRGGRLRGEVRIEKLPARILLLTGLARPAHGEFNGTVRFSGTSWRPVTTFEIGATDIRQAFAPASAALHLTARGRLTANAMEVAGALGTGARKEALTYRLHSRKGRAGGVEARVAGRIDMAALSNSGLFWAHRISGTLTADLTVVSGAGAPQANGHITLANGQFVHAESGAVFRNLTVRAAGANRHIRIVRAAGDDGSGGRIAARGELVVDADQNYPFEVTVQATNARVVRREDMQLIVSGAMRVRRRPGGAMAIRGDLTVNRGDLSIAGSGGVSFARLDVTEINKPEWLKRLEQRQPQAAQRLPVRLALDVNVPRRFWVRGRGLTAELQGKLRLRGTAARPRLTGQLTTVRGHVDLLGKRFDIRHGEISFVNPEATNPRLDFEARAAATGVTATIRLGGTAKRPRFSIDSAEGLPRDQVLSQLLFGKDVTQLTTSESIQLAAGAATLFGPGDRINILERLRRATGLDVVDVTGGTDGPRAVVGKYVTDRVLVKAEQGVREHESAVGVEVEVTKNIRVEAKTGTDGTSRVGIKWQHDY